MKKRIYLIIITALSLTSCKQVLDKEIVGIYKQDKFVQVSTAALPPIESLTLSADHVFILESKTAPKNVIKGKWEVLNSRYSENSSGSKEARATIGFSYKDKTTMGELRGTIIRFSAPEGFHPDLFGEIIYVKQN